MGYLIALGVLTAWLCWINLRWMRRGRPGKRRSTDVLDQVVFHLGGVRYTGRDCCQGALILGQVGSGKTTGVMATMIDSLLGMGAGMLYVCAKPDDRARMLAACKRAGRSRDVIVIDKTATQRLSFFRTLLRVDADMATLAQLGAQGLDVFSQVSGKSKSWGSDNRFWEEGLNRMTRSIILLLLMAKEEVTPTTILKVATSLPKTPKHIRTPEWKESYCGTCLRRAYETAEACGMEAEFDAVSDYFMREIASFSLKNRSNIIAMLTGTCDSLTKGIAAKLFGTDSTFDLAEAIKGNRVIIVDFPYGEWAEIGRFVGAGMKYLTQREILQREVKPTTNIFALVCDEVQNILTEPDWNYVSMQRSFRGPLIAATQGWESILSVLGQQEKSKADVLAGNLGAKFICSPTFETARWVCETLGKKRHLMMSGGTSTAGPQSPIDLINPQPTQAQGGFSEQWGEVVNPNELSSMRTGGPPHFEVDCLFIQPGRERAFYPLTFSQRGDS